MERIRVGTRGSELALVQATTVEGLLRARFPGMAVERRVIKTTGDRRTDVALAEVAKAEGIVDKGVFIKELETALVAGEVDVAVHSLKDVPTVLEESFELVAVLPRAGNRDAVVSRAPGGLAALPAGAVVGTSSVRRARQLSWLRPDLAIDDLRGNVPTRLAKLAAGRYDAILLAEAGMVRLGHDLARGIDVDGTHLHVEVMDDKYFLPAAGQGAIGLEIRAGDAATAAVVKALNDDETWWRVVAEREFLRLLEAGCHTPVGVWTEVADGVLRIGARVFPEAGGEPLVGAAEGPLQDALAIAGRIYQELRAGEPAQPSES